MCQAAGAEQGGRPAEAQHPAEEGGAGADAQSEEEPPLPHQGEGAAPDRARGGEESLVSLRWCQCPLEESYVSEHQCLEESLVSLRWCQCPLEESLLT